MLALFGKLPAKRDFVARGVPAAVLAVIEPFLQASVAEGKDALGPEWTERFLTAPIWRFWWSRDICGAGAKGAVMPSVDAVGRYFPLTAIAVAPEGRDHPAPSSSDEPWYAALEDALLCALAHAGTLDDLLGALSAVPPPPPPDDPGVSGTLWWTISGRDTGPRKAAWSLLPPHRTFGLMLAGASPGPAVAAPTGAALT